MSEYTSKQRVAILLEFYRDVEAGLSDYTLRDDNSPPIFGMGPAWNHVSYVRLRELVRQLASEKPELHWHVAEMYLRWRPNLFRRVAFCPACKRESPAAFIGSSHKHGQKHVDLMPRIARAPSQAIDDDMLDAGVSWLERNWGREVYLPEAILDILDKAREGKVAA